MDWDKFFIGKRVWELEKIAIMWHARGIRISQREVMSIKAFNLMADCAARTAIVLGRINELQTPPPADFIKQLMKP